MSLFKRRDTTETIPPTPAPAPVAQPKVEKKEEPPDPMFRPLEPEPPGTPRQRGFISDRDAALLRMQLQIADNLRQKFLAPSIPLDLPLERTPELEKLALEKLQQLIGSSNFRLPPTISQEEFIANVLNEAFGYGPIQPLVDRTDITEIMVNGPYIIFVEKNGRVRETGFKFLDDDHVERIIKRIVLPLGRTVSVDHPLIDARLPDGSRVNAVIRPCAIDGPNITIRKFSKEKLTMNDLLRFGSLNEDMARFLEAAVVSRRNIIVSGGTGSGKTTLINILSGFIPEHERTVTIEDAAELQLRQRNVVRLETKKPNPLSPTEVTIRQCVVNALRMRPERIVVGECRSGEALDMLQAMNTGHDGSMTTIHANSPRDCISRLETLVLMAGVDLPLTSVRKQIASAIHMIVQAARLRDGSRKVTNITEIIGMEGETVIMQDIYKFFDEGDGPDGKVMGYHGPTGVRPECDSVFKQYGFNLPPSMFMKKSAV
ncbi:MAG TPA: CpaF family protein [Anaerolineae bacterium]|nr:CpaF family protein [Anaerolineae bacterium]HQK15626.1 CpaF family protein [Anaerolineae bacterium]